MTARQSVRLEALVAAEVARARREYDARCDRIRAAGQQVCWECGHVANVSADCTMWACAVCQRVQPVAGGAA